VSIDPPSSAIVPVVGRIEMRTSARFRILQRCVVFPATSPTPPVWRCIAFNISATGIGLAVPALLPRGTALDVQAWDLAGARPLRVKVIHARQVEFAWFTGCELHERLSDAELLIWRGGPLDWVEKETR
jgi:hypothetical protein